MKKWCLIFFSVVLVVMSFLPAASTFASETKRVNVLILFKKHVDEKAVEQLQGEVYRRFEVLPALSANVPLASVDVLRQLPEVEYVQQDETVTINKQVTDWGVTKTKAPNMHVRGVTGKGVKIAILDTGIDTKHPDLHVSGGVCLLSNCPNSYNDDNGHGTHVAGIIAAQNNQIGVLGVAPEASIYAVKVLNRYGDGTLSTVLAGIEWAIQHKMDIINLSLATPEDSPVLKKAIDKAYQQGLLIVAAVGNNGNKQGTGNTVEYPAKYDSVIAVSAVDKQNVRAAYSATGSEVEVAAPGEEIYSTVPAAYDSDGNPDGYTWMSGTSMAAPFVSGVLALYKQQYPNKTNVELRQMLRENAVDLGAPGKDDWYGYGLVQAEQNKPPQLEVKLQSNAAGVVNFFVTLLADSIQGYNVYRDGKQIKKLQTSSSFSDYALKGTYRYQFSSIYSDGTESALSNPVTVTLSEPDFKDLTNDIWYTPHIVYLFSRGIITGYNNGTVKPNDFVTRAEAVAVLGRALHLDSTKRSTVFKDVDSSNMASGYIQSAYERGLVNGFPDGTFRPQQPITRAETAMLLAKAYQLPSASSMAFKDVTDKVTGHAEIYKIAAANITKGYPDGTFRPYQSVKRLEFFVFIARAENDIFK